MTPALFRSASFFLVCASAAFTGCSYNGPPAHYKARFDTSQGAFVIEVRHEWAPIGADRFYELVKSGFYDEARFFRVAPGFVLQWGIARDPMLNSQWKDKVIPDDPVKEGNLAGYVSFASRGANTRTTQIFINLANNIQLDSMGFAAFGRITDGLDVISRIYGGYRESPDQGLIETQGNAYLNQSFPKLDYIKTARIE